MKNKLYTYIITNDNGLSPCYCGNIYTLACCKPQIRRMIYKSKEEINDNNYNVWVIGVRRENGKPFIVYLAKITKVLKLEEYYSDNGIYTKRCDCNYRNIKSMDNMPITINKGDGFIDNNFKKIYAKKGNEHGKFKDIKELNAFSDTQYHNIGKDICGNCVLLSEKFIHFSQIDPENHFALNEKFGDVFQDLLNDYEMKNRRIYHGFDLWDKFYEIIDEDKLKSDEKIFPLDPHGNNDCGGGGDSGCGGCGNNGRSPKNKNKKKSERKGECK